MIIISGSEIVRIRFSCWRSGSPSQFILRIQQAVLLEFVLQGAAAQAEELGGSLALEVTWGEGLAMRSFSTSARDRPGGW